MKKRIKYILVSSLCILAGFCLINKQTSGAETSIGQIFKRGSFSYEIISDKEVAVYRYDHQDPDIMELVSSVEYSGKKYNVTRLYYDHSDVITKKIIVPNGIREVIINPDGVNGYKYSNLQELILPDTLEYINRGFSFTMTNLKSIKLSGNNKYYKVQDNVLFNKSGTDLIAYPSGDDRTSYSIPKGVKTIKKEAFASNQNLQDIFIPDSVSELEQWTFSGSHIQALDLSSVKRIGRGTFEFCSDLKEIKLGKGSVLGGNQFYENRSLENIIVENGNPDLWSENGSLYGHSGSGDSLICYPPAKEEVSYAVPAGTNCIEYSAFSMCRLNQIYLPASVRKISSSAFNYGDDGKAEKPIQIYLCSDRLPEMKKASFADLASGSTIFLKNNSLKEQFIQENEKNQYIDNQAKESEIQILEMEEQPARDIILNRESLSFDMGENGGLMSSQLGVSLVPLMSTDKISFSGSDSKIIKVDVDGVITAVSPGMALVTVRSGNIKKECRVTVYGSLGSIDDIPRQFYTGAEVRPELVVRNTNGEILSPKTDYTVQYKNNINSGTAEISIEGVGCYRGSLKKHFDIRRKENDISRAKVVHPQKFFYYEGKPVTPKPSVTLDEKILVEGRDYRIEYMANNSIGSACACLNGMNDYYGQNFSYFQIIKKEESQGGKNPDKKVKISFVSQPSNSVYTGKAIYRSVKVKSGSKILKQNRDYTVKYSSNKYCGKARMNITGKGKYTGNAVRYFFIVPKKARIKKLKAGKKRVKVYVRKSQGKPSGYQICWAANKKFSGSKSKYTSKLTLQIKGLRRKKYYYIKVRAYKTVKGKKYFGSYSQRKRVRVK